MKVERIVLKDKGKTNYKPTDKKKDKSNSVGMISERIYIYV